MPLFRQLEFVFRTLSGIGDPGISGNVGKVGVTAHGYNNAEFVGQALCLLDPESATEAVALQTTARELLRANGAARIAYELRVEWNSRLQTAAGRADYREKLISLNPRLLEYPEEVERTLRHELAHILAQFRAGRRRIPPHGVQWQKACIDLGINDEKRCHHLPFPTRTYAARFVYRCPNCRQEFARVRRVRRAVACLACCRKHAGGEFDSRFRLRLVTCNGGL